ncbi:GTPase-activating protein [Psychromonas sp. MME1]|uniref:GTPase-activating protein n=1 Tax=Psychromonas sp. MME1 TaxID=3231032 RepID=UPI0034E2C0EE
MSRTKKNRNAGNSESKLAPKRKETSSQAKESRERKRKEKLKGNKAGARNAVQSKQTQQQNARQAANDKRIGSQKAVPLLIEEKQPEQQINRFLNHR